jgi:hypothetical protein
MHILVYELSDLQSGPIEEQFYNHELLNVNVSTETEFEIHKIVRTGNKGCIKEHLVKWKGYDEELNSCVYASEIKII